MTKADVQSLRQNYKNLLNGTKNPQLLSFRGCCKSGDLEPGQEAGGVQSAVYRYQLLQPGHNCLDSGPCRLS